MVKTFLVLAVLVTMTASMMACNTVEGAGKDTKKAGQSIENAADKNK